MCMYIRRNGFRQGRRILVALEWKITGFLVSRQGISWLQLAITISLAQCLALERSRDSLETQWAKFLSKERSGLSEVEIYVQYTFYHH